MNLTTILNKMDKLNGFELEQLKTLFDNKYTELVELDSNYMLHDFPDGYTYIVYYPGERKHYYCKGREAYKEYIRNGIRLERRTHDLYPTYEILERKVIA